MAAQITPSYEGIVLGSRDALLLFTAAIQGHIPMISRRPHDRERACSIASGNVFIYCENNSSIKRWTDGVTWSPSRIMGNFLIYRELNKGFPPGEKKRASRKQRAEEDDGYDANDDNYQTLSISKDQERTLIGSLIESYDFKREGLVKKTISARADGQVYHLVSYYTLRDAISGGLLPPSSQSQYAQVRILEDLLAQQTFRVKVDAHGNDVNNNNTPPASPPLTGPLSHDYREQTYPSAHLPEYGTAAYSPASMQSARDYGQRETHLQYDSIGTGRNSYPNFMTSSGQTPRTEHDGLLYQQVPRSSQLSNYSMQGGGGGDFAYPENHTRSYSTRSGLPNLEGNNSVGLAHGRSASTSYASGSHYSGSTDPSSYTIAPATMPTPHPNPRFMGGQSLTSSLGAAENPPRLNTIVPLPRNIQTDHADETQRVGMPFQQVGDDSYSTPTW